MKPQLLGGAVLGEWAWRQEHQDEHVREASLPGRAGNAS